MEIQVFKHEQFGEIRTMTDEKGEPWFVGKDVARHLGYINHRKALRDHVDEEDRKNGVTIRDSIGRDQEATFINESGLYSLVLASKLPQAKAFKRWVTQEVLPQIRKMGGYIPTKDNEGHELSAEEILERANAIVGRTLLMLNAPNDNCLTATQVATDWGMNVRSFNALLRMMGVQYRRGGRWHLSKELQGLGYAEDRHYFSYSLKGSPRQTTYLVWTPKGVRFLNSYVHSMPLLMQPKSIQLSIEF
jgi:prophage antirepressor-like protein